MILMHKVIFIVDNIAVPRCIKRIKAFVDEGYDCEVFGYKRSNIGDARFPLDVKITILRYLENGKHYFSRLFQVKKDVAKIVSKYTREDCIFYSFGFVSSLFVSFYTKHFIYEISDIRYGSYPKLSNFIPVFKVIDRWIIKKSYLTVLTSGGFKDFLGVNDSKILIIPNSVNLYYSEYNRSLPCIEGKSLRFAFVGAVRYMSIFRFAEVIGEYFPKYTFSFYGKVPLCYEEKCKELLFKYKNVFFYGAFKNPEDLEYIYNNIDIVVSSYDVNTLNERIAEPNKLYESIFFCRPIVVSSGTYLAERVNELGCGFDIDVFSECSIKMFVDSLTADQLKVISEREILIDKKDILDKTKEIVYYIKQNKNESMAYKRRRESAY